jgi:hypothetical protein
MNHTVQGPPVDAQTQRAETYATIAALCGGPYTPRLSAPVTATEPVWLGWTHVQVWCSCDEVAS